MNVAGAGLAGFLIAFFFMLPILFLLYLIGLGFMEKAGWLKKIIFSLLVLVGSAAAFYFLFNSISDSLFGYYFLGYLTTFLSVCVPLLFFLNWVFNKHKSTIRKIFIFSTPITLMVFAFLSIPEKEIYDDEALGEMAQYLGLQKISARKFYYREHNIIIKNDTLIGLMPGTGEDSQEQDRTQRYYYHSTANPENIIYIDLQNVTDKFYKPEGRNLYYKNGVIYGSLFHPSHSGSVMQKLGLDGSFKELFFDYEEEIGGHSYKFYLYKDKAVYHSQKGVFIFKLAEEELLQSRKFSMHDGSVNTNSCLLGNYFVYTQTTSRSDSARMFCLDLDKLTVKWQLSLPQTVNYGVDEIYNNGKDICIIKTRNGLYFIDVVKGEIIAREDFYLPGNKTAIEDEIIYFVTADSSGAYHIRNKNIQWKAQGGLYFVYKDKVVGADENNYFILNKHDGRLEKTIPFEGSRRPISIKDNYLLRDTVLYK